MSKETEKQKREHFDNTENETENSNLDFIPQKPINFITNPQKKTEKPNLDFSPQKPLEYIINVKDEEENSDSDFNPQNSNKDE